MDLSPIIIFAFNRPNSIKKLVSSLLNNPEAKDSDLFIFVDGPRNQNDELKLENVRDYVKTIKGFKTINYNFSGSNKGLGPSIISGVTSVLNKYGTIIVLEDDLIVQPNFLKFMNDGLIRYKNISNVFSICGYTNKIKRPANYPYDAYFASRSSSWGWATWKDRWNSVDWKLEPWEEYIKYRRDFNKWGGSDCFSMLKNWRKGKNKSWAIRFCFSEFLQNKVSLFPIKSLVINNGFDGEGTNCKKWSRFKCELMPKDKVKFELPDKLIINKRIQKEFLKYNSLLIRIYSKLMYLIHR